MSYDRVWIESTEHPRGLLERYEAGKKNLSEEFHAERVRLDRKGDFVVLSAGKNCMFDELFLFETCAGALEFYDLGFRKWEHISEDGECMGFQEVSLYWGGRRIASKSYERPELHREGNEELRTRVGS